MRKKWRNLLIACSVSVVLIGLFEFLGAGGLGSTMLAVAIGSCVHFILKMTASNRSVVRASDAERKEALRSAPPPELALLYLYREGFLGKSVGIDVKVDGQSVAQLKSPRFTRVTITPGTHILSAGNPGFAGTQSKSTELNFDVASGDVIAFALKQSRGMIQNSLTFERESNAQGVLRKLAAIPMVSPDRPSI